MCVRTCSPRDSIQINKIIQKPGADLGVDAENVRLPMKKCMMDIRYYRKKNLPVGMPINAHPPLEEFWIHACIVLEREC